MIPFNQPGHVGRELDYVEQALSRGHTAASGPFSARAAAILRDRLAAPDVLLTTSCTDALEMTALLLDLGAGDTVIVPSFTFTSTALAFARQGVNVRFADIEPVTLGIDPASVESLMDDTVRAVVAVHYAGVACDLQGLGELLDRHDGVELIEDNAHGLFGTYERRQLGTFGRLATLSFHETKNFICGEGGALIVNESADVDRAHTLLDKGTNRRQFMLGQVDKYSWKDTGSSFGLSDLLAAFLTAQLEGAETILASRAAVTDRYEELLAPHSERLGFTLPVVPGDRTTAHHMYYVLLPSRAARDAVLRDLGRHGVQATFHYVPLHSSEAGRKFSDRYSPCPITDDISGRLLRLPFYNDLTPDDQKLVADTFVSAVEATSRAG